MQHSVMLKHAGDNVPLPLCPQSGGGGTDCPVVGFGTAAGKENLPRLAAQSGSYLFPGKLYIPLGVSAQGINAGGIAVLPGQIGQHSLQHGPGHLCGGGVVSINHSFFHTDPSPVDFLPFYYAIRILYRISRNFARGNEKIFSTGHTGPAGQPPGRRTVRFPGALHAPVPRRIPPGAVPAGAAAAPPDPRSAPASYRT